MPPLDHGTPPLLDIDAVTVRIPDAGRSFLPVRGASLELRPGETLAVIGESGSGKSMLGLAVVRLLPGRAEVAGGIRFGGRDILSLDEDEMAAIRGRGIAFVPQGAGLALNPCMRAVRQVEEVLERDGEAGTARQEARLLMARLGLEGAAGRMYPHQLSGGMRQRLLLAMGLTCRPRLLIADEPTKGIDSRRVEDVIALFRGIRADRPELAMMVITHDLRFARAVADRVAVMYAGDVVEEAPAGRFFAAPRHPYSQGLLGAMPEFGLNPIPGASPPVDALVEGCAFAPRCRSALPECRTARPPRVAHDGALVACRRP